MLTTNYLGLELTSPLVASAGPLSQTVDGVRSLAASGVGAVVMYSLFEEQLRTEVNREIALVEAHEESYAEATSYFPETVFPSDQSMAHEYLTLVEQSAKAIDVPLIASLNGADLGGWTEFAGQLQDAGAAALELNIYAVPGDVHLDGRTVEKRHVEIVQAVKERVSIPIAVKLSPYFSSTGQVALSVLEAGADGLVLFNRWLQPDIDIETLAVVPGVELSHPSDGKLPRTWIATLRNQTTKSLALTSGVETADDVIKDLLAGADVVMRTSALVRHGTDYATILLGGLDEWMERKGFSDIADFRGMLAVGSDADGTALQRAGYVAALERAKTTYGSLA